ncbi:unnamed protein product [Phaedon cochleariae]|uniref:Sensory neuron membrane protein 2 n=1 Tax=Phaedon cochleariae TaxID=80249 RepID=A0A9P0DGA4_PHACE|nr:unnamed protein product [Phaedon cochleariae]
MLACSRFFSVKVLCVFTAVLTIIFAGVLVLAFYGVPVIIDKTIQNSVQLDDGTIQWDRFVDLPVDIILKIFLYHVKNPDEIVADGAKPILEERGPYCYKQNIHKNILSTNSTEDTVTFERTFNTTYDQEASGNLTEDDKIVILNPVILTLFKITSVVERFVVLGCLDRILPEQYNKLFIEVDIRTIMFEGFAFAKLSNDLGPACNIVRNQVLLKTLPMKNVQRILDEEGVITELRFAFLQYKIRYPDGKYTVNRGLDDITKLGQIIRWNDESELSFWGRIQSTNNDTCNKVRGSDSTIYPPHVTKTRTFDIYSTDICRIVQISFQTTDTYSGIDAYRFGITKDTFRSATPNPENDCYCIQQSTDVDGEPSCFLDGVLDVFPCFGAPILLSFPHFLYADESYVDAIDGLSPPDPDIHELFLLIEPNTGTPLQGMKRVQLNTAMMPIKYIPATSNLSKVIMPMLWLEEGVSLPQNLIDELSSKYFNVVKIVTGVMYGLIAVAAASVLISSGFLMRKNYC